VAFVSEYREILGIYFKFAMPNKVLMRQLLNKKTQYSLAEKMGISLPKTFYPDKLGAVKDLDGKIDYPVILKPIYSIKWRKVYGVTKVQLVHSREELINAYRKIKQFNLEVMIQEVVVGPDTNHYKICLYLNKDSEPLLLFTLKKMRNYPCYFGVGSAVESQWYPEVADLGLHFLKGIKYVGVGSIEFKKDIRDNQLKMIELNSRLWLQNSLAERCGMNFPYTQYLDLIEEKVEQQSDFNEGIKWIYIGSDFASFKGYHKDKRLSYINWFKSLRGKKTFAVFAWDDMKPFLHSIEFGLVILKKSINKIKLLIRG
jgi:predicted ATP-grasp superfamily ATP-dependent carboligase